MASSSTAKLIGCIGRCTTGLSLAELNQITEDIRHTLNHHRGRQLFHNYLEKGKREDDLACLDLYNTCTDYVNSYEATSKSPSSLENLRNGVSAVLRTAEELDVVEIDAEILERLEEASSKNGSKDAMLEALQMTKERLAEHLKDAHKGFRSYISKPCPNMK